MFYFAAYILAILIVNILFSYVPLVPTAIGLLSPVAFLVGGIFVLRDFAQRAIGHHVVWGIVIGAGLSWWLADPFVAVASVLAFTTSEVADWILYTITKKPFYKRVWISSLLSTPIDTGVFLYWIDQMHVGTFLLMIASKLVAAAIIWFYGHKKQTASMIAA